LQQPILFKVGSILDEEEISKKRVSLQAAALSQSQTDLYLSFDSNPFDQEASIHEKHLWVESLLATLSKNNLTFQNLHLLVHHQEIIDPHLDFSQGLPGCGFLNTTDHQKHQ
jgi:hypothetical protein